MGEIIVKISPDGSKVEMEGEGIDGSGCLDAASDLIDRLGGEAKIEKKPEYYNVVGETVNIGG